MSSGNICIIEDEKDIVDALTTFLEAQNFTVISFNNAEEFYSHVPRDFNGLYLVDWNLPGEPGINIISKIRESNKFSPIFMVSAYTKNEEILTGLKAGADDYITKPFSLEELLARIENAQQKLSFIGDEVSSSSFKLLPEATAFIKEGKTVNLTQREFIIFNKLHEELGQAVTRDELILCFKNDEKMTVRNIDVHVFSLRKKIKEVEFFIDTVWGKGYKLI
jgi:two-component system alkaline phosphatase synthesis response regulator PhoP